jgi:hypothetical protein
MTWKLKKDWEGKSLEGMKLSLEELSQEQILKLSNKTRNMCFVEDKPKPKKKKKNDSMDTE